MKSLRRVFDKHFSDKNQEATGRKTTKEGLDAIGRSLLPEKFVALSVHAVPETSVATHHL